MPKKRPCAICRCWFEVDPRVGKRHRVCDATGCQQARNKRSCARWRAEHPDDVKAARLRKRLPKAEPDTVEAVLLDPMRYFDPDVVRHVIGVEVQVVLEESAKVVVSLARHEMPPKPRLQRSVRQEVPPPLARHETATPRAPP